MCSCYQPFQGCSYVNHLRVQHKVLSYFLSFLHQNTSCLPDQPTSFPLFSPISRWQWYLQFPKSIKGSHPAVPEFQQSLPKYLSLLAFLSPNFSASLFLVFLNRLLPCFPSDKMPSLSLTPDTSQWCHLPLVKLLRIFFMVLHNSSLALNPLYSCSRELASSGPIFSHFSMLGFRSGTPSHFLWLKWLLCHCFIMNNWTSLSEDFTMIRQKEIVQSLWQKSSLALLKNALSRPPAPGEIVRLYVLAPSLHYPIHLRNSSPPRGSQQVQRSVLDNSVSVSRLWLVKAGHGAHIANHLNSIQ